MFRYRVSRADWQLLQEVRKHLPEDVDVVFLVPHLGDEVKVLTSKLRLATERVSVFIDKHPELLPYTYQFKQERGSHPAIASGGFGTGALSGFRLPDNDQHYYLIRAGLNECFLEKNAIGPDGKGHIVERRDLRGEREVQTATVGRISIRRTRAKTDLKKGLRQISEFLASVTAQEVIKSVG